MTAGVIGLAAGTESVLSAELAAGAAAACRELGLDVRTVRRASEARGVDLLVGVGYPRDYPALFDTSAKHPRVGWLGEPLPPTDESAADFVLRRVPMGRVLDVAIRAATLDGRRHVPGGLSRWREMAAYAYDHRFNVRAHRVAARAGIRIVVTSRDRAASLARMGIRAPVVPFGYHPVFAGEPCDPADTGRDIDLLVLSTATTGVPTRRARIAADTLAKLHPKLRVLVVEDGLWGTQRSAVLRRARIVLNVHRVPGNSTGIRSVLAAAGGALVISEPIHDAYPFVSGRHHVEVPASALPEAIAVYLADDERRIAIARAAQAFVVEELTMRRSVASLIEAVP